MTTRGFSQYIPVTVVAIALVLLVVLAAIQYRSQVRAAETERAEMKKRLADDTGRFADSFNREIQSIYLNFQVDPDSWRRDGSAEVAARLAFWRSKTDHPDLIKEIAFIENKAGGNTLRYSFQNNSFESGELPAAAADVRSRLENKKDVRSVYPELFALAIPIHNDSKKIERILIRRSENFAAEPPMIPLPEKIGHLVLILDENVVTQRILPELAEKYFGATQYVINVTSESGGQVYGQPVAAPESQAALFDLSPDRFFVFNSRDAIARTNNENQGVMLDQRVESHTVSRVEGETLKSGTFKIELQRNGDDKPRTSIFAAASAGPGWRLNVQHASGSVDEYVNSIFRRSIFIGAGMFTLIAAAIVGIFVSAQRARSLAQRQLDFVSSVSHEFRTPLAVIYSAGENLADGVAQADQQVARYGELIKGEGRKLSTMVEQILRYAGADSGKQKYSFAEVDISRVVLDTVEQCRPLADANNVIVETDMAADLPMVKADREAISSAVQNLIANAVKYGGDPGGVRVTTGNGGGKIKITVEDDGIGIGKEDLKHIFEPFYRSKEVVDSQIHGNGLGLALVRQIAAAHGGRVYAESEPGKGSKFTLEIPADASGSNGY